MRLEMAGMVDDGSVGEADMLVGARIEHSCRILAQPFALCAQKGLALVFSCTCGWCALLCPVPKPLCSHEISF